MTIREYISFWQETYDKHQSRPTTYAAHGYIFKNHIIPGLGDIPLSELTVEKIEDFLEERKHFGNHRPESPDYPGLNEHTMRHIHRLLQQCLDQAIRDGLMTDNPAKAFHYPKPKKVKANVLTPLEMEDYLDAAERLNYLPMFMLALTAGLGLFKFGRKIASFCFAIPYRVNHWIMLVSIVFVFRQVGGSASTIRKFVIFILCQKILVDNHRKRNF